MKQTNKINRGAHSLTLRWKATFLMMSIVLFSSCIKDIETPEREKAWVPVYISPEASHEIKLKSAQPTINGGKIYAWNDYLFQVESNQGIHIYTLENKKPIPHSFIQILGAQEIALKNNILYSNNINDIVSIDLQNLEEITLLSRVENVFDIEQSVLPPEHGYFECVDPKKGMVVGWELKSNVRVKCKY